MLCQSQNGCLFYRKGCLYYGNAVEEEAELLMKLPMGIAKRLLCKMRLMERLLRLEPRFAVPYESGFLMSWNGALYYVDRENRSVRCMHKYREGMNNPLSINKIEEIDGFSDGYVYGDYWGNPHKEAVSIYRLDKSGVKCVYSFQPEQVLHIHGIVADQKTGRVLICTGDKDEESAIWEAFDDFQTVRPIVQGSQIYRTCAPYITKSGILYATDTPLCDNGIYLYCQEPQQIRKIYDMPGPCIYAMRICQEKKPDLFVFATSVEPDSNLPSWRYRFTYRLGPGVKSRWVNIVVGNPQAGFQTVTRLKKDMLPMLLFQFGNAAFPYQKTAGRLYCTATAVKKQDGKTLCLRIEEQEGE